MKLFGPLEERIEADDESPKLFNLREHKSRQLDNLQLSCSHLHIMSKTRLLLLSQLVELIVDRDNERLEHSHLGQITLDVCWVVKRAQNFESVHCTLGIGLDGCLSLLQDKEGS